MTSDASYVAAVFPNVGDFETVQAILLPLQPLGFLEEDSGWTCYFDIGPWLTGGRERFHALMKEHFPALAWTVQEIPKQNWNKEWEDSILPIDVSRRFIIAPSWNVPRADPAKIVLVIDPKMSFGTGYHETTRLMLRLMERIDMHGTRVLDVGTGTGILAIAALKLGASSALGIDIDEWSYDNTMENAERNGVGGELQAVHGSLETVSGIYDVILSNITRNDNIGMFPDFAGMLPAGGHLVVSGFHLSDTDDVIYAAERNGLRHTGSDSEHEWAALMFTGQP